MDYIGTQILTDLYLIKISKNFHPLHHVVIRLLIYFSCMQMLLVN